MTASPGAGAGSAPAGEGLDPDALVDTHVHFWDHSLEGFRWPWLEPGFRHRQLVDTHQLDAPRYTTPEFRSETDAAGVAGMVHVHAAERMPDPSRETEWLQSMGDEIGWPHALVGACPLREAGAPDLLHRHARFGRLRGVRDVWGIKELQSAAEVKPALDTAAELGLSIELRLPLDRFHVLREIADRWPDVTLVLGHAGLPQTRSDDDLAQWRAALRDLAGAPNAVCKISAVAGSSDPDWTVESIRPWVFGCIDAFGPDRCMFGTNWPVDRLFGTYHAVVDAYREVVADLDAADRARLFHGTAARVYGLTLADLAA